MARRFKNYKFALETLRNPDTNVASPPPTGTALDNYKKYRGGEITLDYTRENTSKPQELLVVAINPFGLTLATTSLVRVKFSKRVDDNTTLNSIKTVCNQQSADTVLTDLSGFIPAKAVVFVEGGTSPTTPPKSQITGVPYNPVPGNSYTFPYGQDTGKTVESQVRADILTAVDGLTAQSTVSFSSEKL